MSSWDQDTPPIPRAARLPRPSRVPSVLWGGLVVVLFLFARSKQADYDLGRASENWPEVPGRIDSFAVVPDEMGKPRPHLLYSYEVDGVAHQGTRLHAADHELRTSEAAWLAERLHTGVRVAVRHDPSDPARSALTVGAGADELEGAIAGWFGVVFVAIFGFGLHGNLRRGRVLSIGDALASRRPGRLP